MPSPSLATLVGDRENNFNLIRFLAASGVLFSHSFALSSGDKLTEPMNASLGITFGYIAVDVFFLTSGFLISASLLARASLSSFTIARMLRIYPALVVAVLLTVAIVGSAFTSLSVPAFFANPETWIYLARNTTLVSGVAHTLPGAFENTPWKSAVNASLWTLPYELAMYLLLAMVWFVVTSSRLDRSRWLPRVILGIAGTTMALHVAQLDVLPSNAVRLTAMFFTGATFYVFRARVRLNKYLFAFLMLAIILSGTERRIFWLVYPLALPYVVFCAAYLPHGVILQFNKLGDYSYGIYVYAWPVQQMIAARIPGITASTMLALSFLMTLTLAVASWHLVERSALQWKKPRRGDDATPSRSVRGSQALHRPLPPGS